MASRGGAHDGSRHHSRLARPVECLLRRLQSAPAYKALAHNTCVRRSVLYTHRAALAALSRTR
jgi:hypothetical protein